MRLPGKILVMTLLVFGGLAPAQTTIDFGPTLPGAPSGDWTVLTDQLAGLGATFSTTATGGVAWVGLTYPWAPARYSITAVATQPQQPPWGVEPIRVDFDPYVSQASIRGFDGSFDTDILVLEAYDRTGTQVDRQVHFSPAVDPGVVASVSAAEIAYITFAAPGTTSGLFFDDLTFVPAAPLALEVPISLRPGGEAVNVNPKSKGVLPVVLYGSDTFDVTDVDQASLTLGDSAPKPRGKSGKVGVLADANEDSYLDLQLLFPMADLGLEPSQTELELSGLLLDGTEIVGTAAVNVLAVGSAAHDQGQPLPEPATLALLALGALALIRRGKR